MIFGGTLALVLDSSLITVCVCVYEHHKDIEDLQKYLDTLGGVGDIKWDENKSR
jgi:hypothetical protein